MAVVYTISHPFTNEVVYVGASKNLQKRSRSHLNCKDNTPISNWVKSLISQYMLPKIEVLEQHDYDDVFYFESYWIQQFTDWGFNLLNYNKTNKVKAKVVKISKSGRIYKTTLRARVSKKWDISSLDIGNVFKVPCTIKDRRVLTASFKNYCRQYSLKRYLKYEIVEGFYIATVVAEKQYAPRPHGILKSGRKRYHALANKPKVLRREKEHKFTYGFNNISCGDKIEVPVDKFTSFNVCFSQYRKRSNVPLKLKFEYSKCDNFLNVEYVNISDIVINPKMPERKTKTFGKKGGHKKLTEIQIGEILNSNLPVRVLSMEYDVSESTIYLIKKPKQ